MSEREPWDAIQASLERQFEPPSLDALNERIARAAAELDSEPSTAAPERERSALRPALALAFALAATIALIWAVGLRSSPRLDPGTQAPGPSDGPVAALDPREVAGRQLHDFLTANATLPSQGTDCVAEPPPPSCDTGLVPTLASSPQVALRGECGGATGVDCSAHRLPAQRALLVRVQQRADVIVCIEPPWADPRPVLPPTSEYTIFRRTLGEYVLYEVTPLDRPIAVEHIELSSI